MAAKSMFIEDFTGTAGVAGTFGAIAGVVAREIITKLFRKNGNSGDQPKEFWLLIFQGMEDRMDRILERLDRIEDTMERRANPRD